jgi:hypothetical protein
LFLNSLKGLYLDDIKEVFNKYQIKDIKKLDNLYDYFTFNQKILYNVCNDFEVNFLKVNKNYSILFDNCAFAYNLKGSYHSKVVEATLVADVYSNFLELISSIKGGENGKKA